MGFADSLFRVTPSRCSYSIVQKFVFAGKHWPFRPVKLIYPYIIQRVSVPRNPLFTNFKLLSRLIKRPIHRLPILVEWN